MEKLKGQSLDLEKHSIEKIKELFPEVITEGKIDFERLRHILGDEVDESNEKYQFTWNGKSQTIKLAQKPSTGTLRPANEESKNWDTTENLYIEGDNLEVLKQLQKTYFGKVKTIYIDPPYNTGGDFVYKDDFKDSIKNYKEQTNQKSRSNADTSGRYHTDWLNMMYSRLLLAKNLLSNDGVILISIDESENCNLKKVCDEIFGETNFIANLVYFSKTTGGHDSKHVNIVHENIIVLAKNIDSSPIKHLPSKKKYNQYDFENNKTYKWDSLWTVSHGYTKNCDYPIFVDKDTLKILPHETQNTIEVYPWMCHSDNNKMQGIARWFWNKEKFLNEYTSLSVKFKNNSYKVYKKIYEGTGIPIQSILPKDIVGGTSKGKKELELIISKNIFDNPKSTSLIKYLMQITTKKTSVVLDFFSGSATTAHAVMKLNAEDGGNRKFIMVQLPEKTDEKSEAYKAGYKNICEIGKERIRRAGEQIKQEMEKEGKDSSNLDIGFKVFKLDDTNIKEWDSSLEVSESTLFDQKEIFKEDRTEEDVLYEILLKYGVFDMPVREINILHKKAYDIGQGDMVVALFDDITSEDVKAIGDLKPRVVIFKDSGFKDDNVKLNALHNLQRQGVEDVKSI